MVDYITHQQLEKYEQILDKIQNEHLKCQNFKKSIESAQNQLVLTRLSESRAGNFKIGHVNVKIFLDLFEMCNLYKEEINNKDLSRLLKCEDSKFYLVEVYITNMLLKMVENNNCYLKITVRNDNYCFCKTIEFKNSFSIPIFEVIAVKNSIINCQVIVSLIAHSNDNWVCLNLDKVDVDASYHFEIKKKPALMTISRKLLEISKKHNPNMSYLSDLHHPMILEYEFFTNIDTKLFVQLIIKNSYHKLDLETFSELRNDSENIFSFQLLVSSEKFTIGFDRKLKVVKIKSNFEDLCLIKQYFCEKMNGHGMANENLERKILAIKNASRTQLGIDDLRAMYFEVRKLWATLPI